MSHQSVVIVDSATGTQASVLPTLGFNCFSFRPRGKAENEVLWSVPSFAGGQERPSRSGIPLLFPYPGRLHGKTLQYAGGTFALEGDDHLGNAIHGYVLGRPWRVVEQTASRVTGRFAVAPGDAEWTARWPAAFELTVAYEVQGHALRSTMTVYNPDRQPLPFGLGAHPWFRLPSVPVGAADDLMVRVPAGRRYEQANMLPTGRLLEPEGNFDLRGGKRFGDLTLDDVYTGLAKQDGQVVSSITSADGRCRTTISFSDQFSHCVVFTPVHREAICIEPYTCAPNAYELAEQGVPAGLRVLQPGESAEYWMQIEAVEVNG